MVMDIVQQIILNIQAKIDNSLEQVRHNVEAFSKNIQQSTERATNFSNKMKESGKQTKRFNWHLLSTLFLGMQLQKTFSGLLQPALQAAGIFEIIGGILEILFLPFALLLLEPLLGLMDFFVNLPEPVQIVLGAIVALISVFGTFLFWMSQMGLSFGIVIPAIKGFIGTIVGLGPIILGALGAIKAIIVGVVGGLVSVFGGWAIAIIAIVVLLVTSVLFNIEGFAKAITDYFQNMVNSVMLILNSFVNFFVGIFEMLFGIIEGLWTGNWDRFGKGVELFISGVVGLFAGFFSLIVGNFLNFGLDLGNAFVVGLTRAYGAIKSAIAGIPIIGPMIVGGLDFVEGIAGGLAGAIGGAVGGIARNIGGFFGIPQMADGGIVTRPTLAMIGEAGPEAVIPLSGSGGSSSMVVAPTINLYANINNDLDIRSVSEQIMREVSSSYRSGTL